LPYEQQRLAVSYVFCDRAHIVKAFFSVANDRISREKNVEKNMKTRDRAVRKSIPHEKHMRHYPAVKIGRLGVDSSLQGTGFGSIVLNSINGMFLVANKTGCRFVTVDAYNQSNVLGFYQKNGFNFLINGDENEKTRALFYDLASVIL